MSETKNNIGSKPMKIDFNALSGEEFENMCYWLIEDMQEFHSVHQIGVQNTKAIDISAKKERELYYFQVKRYKDLNSQSISKILKLLRDKIAEDRTSPDAFIIMTSSESGDNRRVFMKEEAKRLGLKIPKLEIWDRNKIENLLYKHKKVLNHFYKDGTNVKIKKSNLSTLLTIFGIIIVLLVTTFIAGLIFDIPFLSDFSRSMFGKIGEKTGYIQDFAQDLDELIILRDITDEINNTPIPDEIKPNIISAQENLINNNEKESIALITNNKLNIQYQQFSVINFILGTAMFIENYKKAEIKAVYEKSAGNQDAFWQLLNNFGVLFYHLGGVEKALNLFEKSETLYNKSPELYRNLAIAYNRTGQSSKALASLLKAEELVNNANKSSGTLAYNSLSNDNIEFKPISVPELTKGIAKDKDEYIKKLNLKDITTFEKEIRELDINDKKTETLIEETKEKIIENKKIEENLENKEIEKNIRDKGVKIPNKTNN